MRDDERGIVIAVNGEIYNFRELRSALQGTCTFRSQSDSEVLLHGYREWGMQRLLEKIEGMYAFVVYDKPKRKLFLVRDRVGIKPLYFATLADRVVWASELKAITRFVGQAQLTIDPSALYDFLTYLYVPAPKTAYASVHKLEPGHCLELDVETGVRRMHRYWELQVPQGASGPERPEDRLRSLVRQTVEQQMVSDVPVGFFLSGGMDSSVVVAEAARVSNAIHTYSIGFDVPGHDETAFARLVAEHFHTRHTSRVLGRDQATRIFDAMPEWFDEPFADTSALPTYLVASLARETSTVVLTGDGGDEVFGGYRWYTAFRDKRRRRVPLPARARRPLELLIALLGETAFGRLASELEAHVLADDVELFAKVRKRLLRRQKTEFKARFGLPEDYDDYWYYRKYYRPDLPVLTRLQVLDFHTYLPDQMLTKVDRATMAVSLEARVPLLGTELLEFCFRLPEAVRYDGTRLKGLMKKAYADVLPREVLERPKKGFSVPLAEWRSQLVPGAGREQVILERWLDRARATSPRAAGGGASS